MRRRESNLIIQFLILDFKRKSKKKFTFDVCFSLNSLSKIEKFKKKINFETINEEGASVLLKEMRSVEAKRYALKTKFIDDLTKILPAKKIIMLEKVEDDFKRKMFEEYRKRRSDDKGPK